MLFKGGKTRRSATAGKENGGFFPAFYSPRLRFPVSMAAGIPSQGDGRMTRDTEKALQHFPTTQWTLVDRAGHGSAEDRTAALDQLLRRYMPALHAHLTIGKRLQPASADDILQEFLVSKVLERDLVSKASAERGRFRGFLVSCLNLFLIDQHRRSTTQARGGNATIRIDENLDASAESSQPQNAFDVAWARQLLTNVIERMRAACQSGGRTDLWEVFQGRLLNPMLHGAEPVSYEELVARHGLGSAAKASNLLVTARRMFVRELREMIAEYEPDEAKIDAEIADLLRILSGAV
jgi:DNA-directed RNA polymerase specialized sigma24 family protein